MRDYWEAGSVDMLTSTRDLRSTSGIIIKIGKVTWAERQEDPLCSQSSWYSQWRSSIFRKRPCLRKVEME